MRDRYNKELRELNHELVEMGTLIEQAITVAISALTNQDEQAAQEVIAFDEEIDHQEKAIETRCMKLILQQQPVAGDLRVISSALKMVTDMERIGDHASDIGELVLLLVGESYILDIRNIRQMANETMDMVVKSIEAFVQKDQAMARWVIAHDDIVDDLFNTVKKELITLINQDMACGEQATDLLMAAKYFERIGDHSVNIAEWVIYSLTGRHVKENR